MLGAQVTGYSLSPTTNPNHWDILDLEMKEERGDIRDLEKLSKAMLASKPDIIFHLAAQPLVRYAYANPIETWSTNVLGTAHVLQAARKLKNCAAIVVVTTDKVYENQERDDAYSETDRLGGHDPYSASKAAAELVVDSYRKSFFFLGDSPLIATVRAGNVIGGGDFSEDRLIPDIVRASLHDSPLFVRSPNSTRPWQHVLDCLSGYLLLGQKLLQRDPRYAESWNFGPAKSDNRSVLEVLEGLKKEWNEIKWQTREVNENQLHEAGKLCLDSTKAHEKLNWRPVWDLKSALEATACWYRAYLEEGEVLSTDQLMNYIAAAQEKKVEWTCYDDAKEYIAKWVTDHHLKVEK